MLGHAEAIASMAAWPAGYPNATANARVKEIFVQHAAAAKATQAPDGRWHQLLNDTDSFLETSVTAMFLTSIIRGVRDGILPKKDYATVRFFWAVATGGSASRALSTRTHVHIHTSASSLANLC